MSDLSHRNMPLPHDPCDCAGKMRPETKERTRLLTRRQLLRVGGSTGILAAFGCGSGGSNPNGESKTVLGMEPKTANVAGDGLILVGQLTFKLPHSVFKVLGISFVVAGSFLKIRATSVKDETETFRIKLDQAQREQVGKAVTMGEHATVVYPDGRKETLEITRDDAV